MIAVVVVVELRVRIGGENLVVKICCVDLRTKPRTFIGEGRNDSHI